MRGVLGVVAILALAACAPSPQQGGAMEEQGSDLLPSVQASVEGDSVRFVLQVTNTTSSPITLTYASGQSFDFAVRTAEGEGMWQWSAARSFIQMIREEELGAGETLSFEAAWAPGDAPAGEYEVEGILTVMDRDVSQRTSFELP